MSAPGDLPSLVGVDQLVVLVARPGGTVPGSEDLITAARSLGIEVHVVHAAAHRGALAATVVSLVTHSGAGRSVVVVAPSRESADADGAEVGRAAASICRRTDADLWEHVEDARRFVRTPGADCVDTALDDLHQEKADPWGVDTRWYEERKRDLVLATLPRRRFRAALELGCSTGRLTAELSTRCTRVVAVDSSPTAISAARRRLADLPNVTLLELSVPRQWVDEEVDLVVVSEVGYFLSPAELALLTQRVADNLADDGVVLLCHWRHPVEGWPLDADRVHADFAEQPGMPPVQGSYVDGDVEIRVHAPDAAWPDPLV